MIAISKSALEGGIPSTVHLHIRDIFRVGVRLAQHALEQGELIPLVRPRDGYGLAAVVGVRSRNHAENRIMIRNRVVQPLQDNRADGVRTTVAPGGIVEWIAVA